MNDTSENKLFNWVKVVNGVAMLLCALFLFLIALDLRPLAQWAVNQNLCVQQEIEKSNAPVSWGVRKCNGRSKVYQVK